MLRPNFESLRATYRDTSGDEVKPPTPAEVLEKRRAWLAGEQVQTGVTAIGTIALSDLERSVFGRALFANFAPLDPLEYAGRSFDQLQSTLLLMARYHMSRAGVEEITTETALHGGYFRHDDNGEEWHINGDPRPVVMVSVVHGASPTRGLTGATSLADIAPDGPEQGRFKPDTPIGPGERLEPVGFTGGTVLCYTSIDGHSSGGENGKRLAAQVKVILPESLVVPGKQ